MIKKVQQTTGGVLFRAWIVSFLALVCLGVYMLSPYINIHLMLHSLPGLSFADNDTGGFYGENIDMSQILPTSQHYIINSKGEDLIDIAANLGINLIRITNGQRSFNTSTDSLYTEGQWDQVLNKMQSKGIKALIVIETSSNNADYYTPDIRPVYLNLVQKYIDSGVFSNPDVYAVDLKNEPLLTDDNISMIQAAHTILKSKYPDLKQTIGWWASTTSPTDPYNPNNYNWSDFAAGKKIANLVDFYSVHMYGGLDSNNLGTGLNPNLRTKVFLSQVENSLQTQKPILIEEFGEANGDAVSDQDTIGSPELQANIYQGVYQALKDMHSSQIMGAVAFDFYSRNQYPDAWAIVKNKGDYLFPAAYILQEYALGKNNQALQATTAVNTSSYLLTNNDNSTTKNVHLSDRIGLKVHLDGSTTYAISLSAPALLQEVEAFHYDPVFDSYFVVYRAAGKGTVQLTIQSNAACSTGSTCNSAVYTANITIQ
jgi:hypothetical protein